MYDYKKYQNEQIVALGFDPDKLSEAQKDILLQPSEAPENYAHDGEVTPSEAKRIWSRKMKEAGFTEIELMNAKRNIGI